MQAIHGDIENMAFILDNQNGNLAATDINGVQTYDYGYLFGISFWTTSAVALSVLTITFRWFDGVNNRVYPVTYPLSSLTGFLDFPLAIYQDGTSNMTMEVSRFGLGRWGCRVYNTQLPN